MSGKSSPPQAGRVVSPARHSRFGNSAMTRNGLRPAGEAALRRALIGVLRFNFSGEGTFAGKPVVPLKVGYRSGRKIEAAFGPVTVRVRRGAHAGTENRDPC